MPSSAVRTFTDPDDYAASIRATKAEFTVTERGHFTANSSESICIGFGCSGSPTTCRALGTRLPRAGGPSSRSVLSLGQACSGAVRRCSRPTSCDTAKAKALFSVPPGRPAAAPCRCRWRLRRLSGKRLAGSDLTPPRNAMLITPRPSAMARLQRLHAAAGRLAENAPEIIANPDAARGLEQALIEAMVGCLDGREVRETSLAQRQHAIVMRRFRRAVEENPDQPLYIPEICKAIRVSGRTLRVCCQEHLGMGPKRYLLLRRLNLAQRTLRNAAPDATTVTEIATRYGFWQLGRFAVEYQSLFGESPSATLRRRSE